MQTLYCISRDLQFENKIPRSTRDDVNLTFQNGVDVQFQKKDKEMNEKRDELKTLCFREGRGTSANTLMQQQQQYILYSARKYRRVSSVHTRAAE